MIRSYQGCRPPLEERRVKGDERILGRSRFVLDVLRQAKEAWEYKNRFPAEGIDFDALLQRLSSLPSRLKRYFHPTNIETGLWHEVSWATSQYGTWDDRNSRRRPTFKLSQPAISKAVAKGERHAKQKHLRPVSLVGVGGEEPKVMK